MPKTKSHRFSEDGGSQIAQHDPDPLELESVLLEIGELIGMESPFDCKDLITYLCQNGYTTEQELTCMKIDFYSFPLFFLH